MKARFEGLEASLRTSPLRTALALGMVLAVGFGAEAARQRTTVPWYGASPPEALPGQLRGDGPYYRATIRSLLEDRDLDLRNQLEAAHTRADSNVALGRGERWYPKHPIVLPVLAAPAYALGGDFGLLVFNVAQLVALGLVLWMLARRCASELAALAATLLFTFGTLLRPAAYNFSPDVLSTLLVMGGLLAMLARSPVVSGFLLGLSVWAKLPNGLLVGICAVHAARSWNAVELRRGGIALAVALGAFGLFNLYAFGARWVTSYDRVVDHFEAGRPILQASHRTFFDVPLLIGFWRQLVDPKNGLLVSAPPLVFAAFGMRALARRSPEMAWLALCLAGTQLATFAPYRLWNESNFGHRFAMTAIVLGVLPCAALIDHLVQRDGGSPSRASAVRRTSAPS